MADNVEASAGSGGATFASDDILGVHYPRSKIVIGADGTNDGDVSSANPLPVTGTVTVQDGGNTITVDGTVAVTNAGLTELAGAINASAQVDVNIAASAATVAVSNAGLTELAAAINASSQMDVNIAASGATVPVSNSGLTELAAAINASSQVDVNIAASGATVPVSNAGLTELAAAINGSSQMDVNLAASNATVTVTGTTVTGTATSGGPTIFRSLDLDETEEEVKSSAGQIYGYIITNFATSTRYVKFYNATAANTTVGTTTPIITIPVPGNASDDTTLVQQFAIGIPFGTALSVAATTGLADNDTGAPGASDVAITVFYA
jgi:hypothetical protein